MKRIALYFSFIIFFILAVGCKRNKAPTIIFFKGESMGYKDSVYTFQIKAKDPEGDDVSYQFDWGDNNQSDWSPFLKSESLWSDTHRFKNAGRFDIQVRAKDIKNKQSEWQKVGTIEIFPLEPGRVVWIFTCEEDGDTASFYSTPIIDEQDNTIYIGCSHGHLHAIRFNGEEKWRFDLKMLEIEEAIYSSPMMDDFGNIYLGTEEGHFISVDKQGRLRFSEDLKSSIYSSPALGKRGEIYLQTEDSLFAFNSNGQLLWCQQSGGGISSPAVDEEGTIYIGGSEKDYKFSAYTPEGREKWSHRFPEGIRGSPFLGPGKEIFVGSDEGNLYCFNTVGELLWSKRLFEPIATAGVVNFDSLLYISTEKGSIFRVTFGGREAPIFSPDGDISSSLAISDEGIIYYRVSFEDEEFDTLYALKENGEVIWRTAIPGEDDDEILASPKIGPNGLIFIGTQKGVYAIIGKGRPANTAWNSFRKDSRNTGRK